MQSHVSLKDFCSLSSPITALISVHRALSRPKAWTWGIILLLQGHRCHTYHLGARWGSVPLSLPRSFFQRENSCVDEGAHYAVGFWVVRSGQEEDNYLLKHEGLLLLEKNLELLGAQHLLLEDLLHLLGSDNLGCHHSH